MDININLFIKNKEEICVQPLSRTKGKQMIDNNTVSTYSSSIDMNEATEKVSKLNDIITLNVYNCSNFLINIFKVYNNVINKIGCPEIKLQKMLLILQICLYQNLGKNINGLNKIDVVSCGFKIHEFSYVGTVSTTDDYSNKIILLSEENYDLIINTNYTFNKLFDNNILNSKIKKLLLLLFQHFGDYDPYVLGQLLNGLKGDEISNEITTLSILEFNKLISDNYFNLDILIKNFVDEAGETIFNVNPKK